MKKLTKLDKIYEDIDQTYGKATEEQIQEALVKLEKELNGKRETLQNSQEQGENKGLEKDVETLEKKVNNIKGYAKNKTQIEKIQKFRDGLEQKLVAEETKKVNYEKNLKVLIPQFEEISNKLKNEKYTMQLGQYEYNNLLANKEKLLSEIKSNRENLALSTKKIIDLKSKIGKCNLAWKTLFVNKDWDEIQLRATTENTRYIRKKNINELEIKNDELGKNYDYNDYNSEMVAGEIGKNVSKILDEDNKENLPAEISVWTKIKNFFRTIPEKVRSMFGKEPEKIIEEQELRTPEAKALPRDEFLEGLRQHVDERAKEAKEKQYVEAHKIQKGKDIEK